MADAVSEGPSESEEGRDGVEHGGLSAASESGFNIDYIDVYATRSRYYVCGYTRVGGGGNGNEVETGSETNAQAPRNRRKGSSDLNSKVRARVLKLEQTEDGSLNCTEDRYLYSPSELSAMLSAVSHGNRGGIKHVCRGVGLIGATKLLSGYNIVVATKRVLEGRILGHPVYSVDGTSILPLGSGSDTQARDEARDEVRYKKLLASVDLSKGFYFSPTFPLHDRLQKTNRSRGANGANGARRGCKDERFGGMYTWNCYMAKPFVETGCTHWLLRLIHGYFKQVRLGLFGFGRVLSLTLVARRSRFFAGTRYRKRGVNNEGHVANHVETEQVVEVEGGTISSFVQLRGSIPLFWSQETSPLSPKPDILLQRFDPLYDATREHFAALSQEYGDPIVVLSLIKQKEKRPREMTLSNELKAVVGFLNRNREKGKKIVYVPWDYSKHSRLRDSNAGNLVSKLIALTSELLDLGGMFIEDVSLQRGILRTNCIDCLDRTNVAQFAAGLVAFGRQLHALKVYDEERLDMSSTASRILMDMYRKMGDELALQYGGSQAHSKALKDHKGEWRAAAQSRELITSIKRFYSNSYVDAERQDAINLFLGHFVPAPGKLALWDLDSDYFLHKSSSIERRGTEGDTENEQHQQAGDNSNSNGSGSDGGGESTRIHLPKFEDNYSSNGFSLMPGTHYPQSTRVIFFDDISLSECNTITEGRVFREDARQADISLGNLQRLSARIEETAAVSRLHDFEDSPLASTHGSSTLFSPSESLGDENAKRIALQQSLQVKAGQKRDELGFFEYEKYVDYYTYFSTDHCNLFLDQGKIEDYARQLFVGSEIQEDPIAQLELGEKSGGSDEGEITILERDDEALISEYRRLISPPSCWD